LIAASGSHTRPLQQLRLTPQPSTRPKKRGSGRDDQKFRDTGRYRAEKTLTAEALLSEIRPGTSAPPQAAAQAFSQRRGTNSSRSDERKARRRSTQTDNRGSPKRSLCDLMITRPLAGSQPWLVGNGPPTEGPMAAKGNETDQSRHLPLRSETPLPARNPATTSGYPEAPRPRTMILWRPVTARGI